MNEQDEYTLRAMHIYGGSFVKCLGEAARHADAENLMKIKTTWPEYWAQYEEMGVRLKKIDDKHGQ